MNALETVDSQTVANLERNGYRARPARIRGKIDVRSASHGLTVGVLFPWEADEWMRQGCRIDQDGLAVWR